MLERIQQLTVTQRLRFVKAGAFVKQCPTQGSDLLPRTWSLSHNKSFCSLPHTLVKKKNRNRNMYFTVKPPISKIPCEVIVLFSLCSNFCQSFPMRAIFLFLPSNFFASFPVKQFSCVSYEAIFLWVSMWSNFSLSFPCEANFHVFSLVWAEVHRNKYHRSIASSTFQCRIIILFSRFHVKNRVLHTILKDQRWNCLLIIM